MSAADFNLLDPGTCVAGRYRVETLLGEGAYAAVYRARDEKLDISVALKVLDPLRSADPVGRGRFEREYQILARMNHPHIARSYAVEHSGGLDVLVLEYVEGETLATRLARGRLEVEDARRFAVQLADAMQSCHAQGVLHRDLKPANIVLHPTRGAMILDFGVAWFSTAMNLTRTGAVVGSPQYMAPEIFSSSITDERADVYSLGVVLFEMLCGHPPEVGASVAELAMHGLKRRAPRVASVRPGVEAGLDEIVAKAIEPNARDRFATASELLEALQSNAVLRSSAQRAGLTCDTCKTPCIIDVPFCPGCGAPVSWNLEAGPYAVQVVGVEAPGTLADWLHTRHPTLLRRTVVGATSRLRHLPAPLAVGLSERSARQLAAEAEDVGADVEVVRAWGFVGAKLEASSATLPETLVALLFHLIVTLALVLTFAWLDTGWIVVSLAPLLGALLGVVAVQPYIRVPLLRLPRGESEVGGATWTEDLRARLGSLEQPKARALAATAIARASRMLSSPQSPAPDAQEALLDAVDAAARADVHLRLLMARPRSRLAAELVVAQRQVEAGNTGARELVRALEQEKEALLEASIAHDLETRRALAACTEISAALA
jgi:hypothetical protein